MSVKLALQSREKSKHWFLCASSWLLASLFLRWPTASPLGSRWPILSCLLDSFPLQTSDAVVKVDVVSGGAMPGPSGKRAIHLQQCQVRRPTSWT